MSRHPRRSVLDALMAQKCRKQAKNFEIESTSIFVLFTAGLIDVSLTLAPGSFWCISSSMTSTLTTTLGIIHPQLPVTPFRGLNKLDRRAVSLNDRSTFFIFYDNKTGARQYTRAVLSIFTEIHSTHPISAYIVLLSPTLGLPPRFIDALFGLLEFPV